MKRLPDYFDQFLTSRGLSADDIFAADFPDTLPYPARTDEACSLLSDCLTKSISVGILSDFDFDGLMSGLVLYCGLRMMGFSHVYLCDRDTVSGYNPQVSELDLLPADTGLLLTSDVGSMAKDLVLAAKQRGMRVIVTDHHPCLLADSVEGIADCFLNPMMDGERGMAYNGPRICGAQVAYLLVQRYFSLYPASGQSLLDSDLQVLSHFAGMAVISDNMPLSGANAVWVKDMLSFFRYINPGMLSEIVLGAANHPVLQNVCSNFHRFVCALQGDAGSSFDLEFLEYSLIPVVNSIKRMCGPTALFYEMVFGSPLLCEDHIVKLQDLNRQRKELVNDEFSRLQRECDVGVNPFHHLFLLPPDVPGGICGLVAQKLAEAYSIPCIVLQEQADGSYSGSARTFGSYLFKTSLSSSGFAKCGGHEEAFGVSFLSYADLLLGDAFVEGAFGKYLEQCSISPVSYDVLIDYDLDFDKDFHRRISRFVSDLSKAGPFGCGNPPASILFKVRFSRGLFTEFGSEYAPHSRIYLGYGFQCILWGTDVLTVADTIQDGCLYLAGTISRHSSLSGSHIRLTCIPMADGADIYNCLASERMVECEDFDTEVDMSGEFLQEDDV